MPLRYRRGSLSAAGRGGPRENAATFCDLFAARERISEQVSGDAVLLNHCGVSDHYRKAKFYKITRTGRRQLNEHTAYWRRLTDVMGRMLAFESKGDEQ